MILNCSHLLGS